MTTDFRALCAELVNELEEWVDGFLINDPADQYTDASFELIDHARAALAEPDEPAVRSREPASVTTEPSDEEIMDLMPQQMRDDLAAAARALAGFDPDNIKAASVFRIILNRHVADHARAVLAHWGTWGVTRCHRLQQENHRFREPERTILCDILANGRLLPDADGKRYGTATPQPVPVAERLPGPRDCAPWPSESDASAWCWVGSDVDGGWAWEQRSAGCLVMFPDDFTHWLPAQALPLPSGEVG